ADGSEEMLNKALETLRTDWSPLAQHFQQELYLRIIKRQPYQDYERNYVQRTHAAELDELCIYRNRMRPTLDDYPRNHPPQDPAARLADE
ncbi:DNA polymerase II, partial [Pseudomonas syringae pv. tagetis]